MKCSFTPRRLFLGTTCAALLAASSANAADKMPRMMGRPDSQMKTVLDHLAAMKPKPIEKLSPKIARMQPLPSEAVMKIMEKRRLKPTDMASVSDKRVPGPAGPITVRVYKPNGAPSGPLPVIVYFHGGGFVIASIADYDGSCRALADMTKAIVAAVDYRMAPESRLPAAHEDSYAATQWIMKNAADWGGNPKKVAVVGESAGGNLATDMCLMAKMRGGQMPVHQVLVYPVVQGKTTQSYREQYYAKPLNVPMMRWFFKWALPSKAFAKNPLASPLYAPDAMFKGLPPATIVLAELDPLRSEGAKYAAKLKKNGIDTQMRLYPGVTHEFFGMGAVVDKAKAAEMFAASRLKATFGS